MADDFQVGNTPNWWDSSRNHPSSSVTAVPGEPLGWTSDPARSSEPDSTATDNNNNNNNSEFQIMGLGLNSNQTLDWNHHPNLLREGEKTEGSSSFRSMMVQEEWRQPKIYSGGENSTGNVFKSNRGFSSSGTEPSESYNSDPMIGYGSPSAILLQGLLATDQVDNRPMNNNYAFPTNYDTMNSTSPWHKFPNQYMNSPSTHDQYVQQPFWNSPAAVTNDPVRQGFFQSNNIIPPTPITFEEKPEINNNNNNTLEGRDLGSTMGKKNNNMNTIETSNKRARSEATPSPLPAFKVRKEKMGDRITALQQLVSPFGKTDTASVLSEAITYIKFLHEQVGVLSSPYMKNGSGSNNSMQQQQQMKSKEVSVDGGGGSRKQDLRSLGLCLVPVSSTFPVTHEPTVDYWNPTFGGTFR